jgi:hypothetical protein
MLLAAQCKAAQLIAVSMEYTLWAPRVAAVQQCYACVQRVHYTIVNTLASTVQCTHTSHVAWYYSAAVPLQCSIVVSIITCECFVKRVKLCYVN